MQVDAFIFNVVTIMVISGRTNEETPVSKK